MLSHVFLNLGKKKKVCVSCFRIQKLLSFPLAVNKHKSQVLTLSKNAAYSGSKKLWFVSTYVAVSRFGHSEDVLIEMAFSNDRLKQIIDCSLLLIH